MVRKPKVLDPNETYTFAKYFELLYAIEDILADLDCRIDYQTLVLSRSQQPIDLALLCQQIQRNIRITELTSEIARRDGIFDRANRHITQDFKLYRVPEELETLTQILLGILSQE